MVMKFCGSIILFGLSILIIPAYFQTALNETSEDADQNSFNISFFDEESRNQYAEYMKDVFNEIQNDQKFQEQLLINNGSATYEEVLEAFKFTSDSARNKLDEIKRREIDRLNKAEISLRKMFKKESTFDRNINEMIVRSMSDRDKEHLHSSHIAEFSVEDLKTLISKIQHDIKMADLIKEKQYKKHEKRKRWILKKSLEKFNDSKDKKLKVDDWRTLREKYSRHKKINEPGSEEQIKEIWKNIDNLDPSYFNPKTFFNLHDLNQDGQWDIEEIEAMIIPGIKEITENKYFDTEELYHEIMKMRQHFIKKMDSDENQIITLDEFETYSKHKDFKRNEEWKVTEELENPIYSDEDIKNFEKELEDLKNSAFNITNSTPDAMKPEQV